jgi:translation initiation factor 4B
MRPDVPAKSPTPETSAPPSPKPAAAPATRPKLNLTKRTVSEAKPDPSTATSDSKASPFGAARPVDTATKEKAIEEKRQLAIRQKKEAEEAEKAARAEEKKVAKEKADQEKGPPASPRPTNERSTSRENGEDQPQQPKYDILRRVDSSTNDMMAEEDEEAEAQLPVDDKAVKPKEVIVDTPATQPNGSWRNGQGKKSAETTTEGLEQDGWSTVSKPSKQRNNRRNPAPPRALAS